MKTHIAKTARTLLMITVMIASAIMPMIPEAAELRDSQTARHSSIDVDVSSVDIYEGDWGWYEVSLDEAPNGVLVITPSSDNAAITFEPAYLKFTKINWDMSQYVDVYHAGEDDNGADTTATISHTIDGTDTVFAGMSVADVSVTAMDMDTDTDGDGDHDGIDTDDDGDGVDDVDEEDGCDLSVDCDGDGTNDGYDEFPTDGTEDTDTDGDGTGDNADDFPTDNSEDTDTDGDGVGDNADEFPDDADEATDSDGDGVGDNGDDFPTDDSEDTDTDGDGVGDNADWDASDANEWNDNDGDGVGDNADTDDDDDTVLDADEETGCDLLTDCDSDGVGDADDAFDNDPEAWDDNDGDGLADTFPNLLVYSYDTDNPVQLCGPEGGTEWYDATQYSDAPTGDYLAVSSSDDDSNGNGYEDTECTFTVPDDHTATVVLNTGGYGGEARVIVDGTTYSGYGTATENTLTTSLQPGTYTLYYEDSWGDGCNPSTSSWGSCWVQVSYAPIDGLTVPSDSGYGTTLDNDDDNDGFLDIDEETCGSDAFDASDMPLDTDGDGLCDAGIDDDDDDDTVLDADEDAGCELLTDCDGDGVGDATDTHDSDASEQTDMDGDGIGDNSDDDRDGDGYLNTGDEFPDDSTEWNDNDGDGTGDNTDTDDDTCPAADGADTDNDGTADATCNTYTGMGSNSYDYHPGDNVLDVDDAFPFSPAETSDNDGDGWGDNADYDDDNDGVSDPQDDDMDGDGFSNDDEDTNCVGDGGDSTSNLITPADMDGDDICDYLDDDIDGDGTANNADAYPEDACADTDTDGDGDPDTITAGCTSSLSEDLDDDFAAGGSTWEFEIYDYYGDGYHYVDIVDADDNVLCSIYDGSSSYNYDNDPISCTVTAEYVEIEWDCDYWYSEGYLYIDDVLTYQGSYSGCYSNGPYTVGTLGTAPGPSWTDAEETECGTDPLDSSDTPTDTDGDGLCDDIQDDDNDGDGFSNDDESTNCGESNDPLDATDAPTDADSDGSCDALDTDDDNDGVDDTSDACPLDSDESVDTDGDLVCDGDDTDDDGDGTADANDDFPLDATEDTDTDGDGTGDNADTDDDDDGTADADDAFPLDATEDTDTDTDGTGDNADTDDDGDGVDDTSDACPLDIDESVDTDGDGDCNGDDADDDNDGVDDVDEGDGSGLTTATDCTLVVDCDGDGVDDGDETDGTSISADCSVSTDCDGDGTTDDADVFPIDSAEDTDTDGDGTGDNADTDDDGDGFSDADETTNCDDGGTYASTGDPLDATDMPDDMDGDTICDALDGDRDGDQIANDWDACPDDASGVTDTDGDGACDESDTDDDDDGTTDADDDFPLDASETTDTDGDGIGDNADGDDDGDGTDDQSDECPLDDSGTTDFDSDGLCDESDADDDGDGVDDADEEAGCELLTDCDGDGVTDDVDAFDLNANVSLDSDDDGYTDAWDSNPPASVTYTLTAQSWADQWITVWDLSTSVPVCEMYTTGPGGDGTGVLPLTDGSEAESTDSATCTVTTDNGILVTASVVYMTYYAAYFGYNTPSLILTSDDGSDPWYFNASYNWYYYGWAQDANYQIYIQEMHAHGTTLDNDNDNDGYTNDDEDINCVGDGGDSLDSSAVPADNDFDISCDYLDDDDDNDGFSDSHETDCGTDPLVDDGVDDYDGDGICDVVDDDDDNDGADDEDDWAPYNAAEWMDTDNDGVGDNTDEDADGDGVADEDDGAPTDRCASVDTDGDGLVDDYTDCSTLGFYSTITKSEGDNAGDGFSDGDYLGITDDMGVFGGAASGDQWFVISDTDGVARVYHDAHTGVASVSMNFAISSTEWESGDYFASYWVDDNGTTIELFHSDTAFFGDIDNCGCEGWWFTWAVEIPGGPGDGYFMGEISSDDDSEIFGVDNVAYWDANGDLIAMATFEDSVENLGGYYQSPADPAVGTYTIEIDDVYGDGGHGITATMNGVEYCSIGQSDYYAYASCTFEAEGYPGDEMVIDVTTDSWPDEGTLTVTFNDGTTAVETWGYPGNVVHTFTYAHVGEVIYALEGEYTIEVTDSYGDGGQTATAWFDGAEVCSIDAGVDGSYDSCTFTSVGYGDSVLDVDFSTDSWGVYEGAMTITFPDGSSVTVYPSAAYATDSYSYAHTGTEVSDGPPELVLSNGWGATVSIDTHHYWTSVLDDDDDNDGYADVDDAFPTDDSEWDDLDGDGLGSNDDDNDDDGDGVNDGVDDFPRHAHATTDTDGDGMPNEIGWTDGEFVDDFETGNFSGFDTDSDGVADTSWTRSGDSSWGITSWTAAASGYGAKSGTIDHNETSTLEVTLETVDGYYHFHVATDTEERYDVLSFSIDGVEIAAFSGRSNGGDFECAAAGSYGDSIPGDWVNDGYDDCGDSDGNSIADDEEASSSWYTPTRDSFEGWVDAGTHTFTWTYSKDDSDSYEANQDKVLIDDVSIPGTVQGDGECSDGTDDCNIEDLDDDNDGTDDVDDACDTDAGESVDTDGDGICDNQDADDDGDGVYDYNDDMPLDGNETTDSDGDGIGDNADDDDDNDGCTDDQDDLPYDDSDCVDTDADGLGDSADPDDDGDNVMDVDDPFPMDGTAWADNDGDGIPDFTGDPPFLGNFEGGAIPGGWTLYGDADWFVCSSNCGNPTGPINGTYMAESCDIDHSETSSVEVAMNTLAGAYSFAYETNSEANWDYLRFYLDGSLQMSWSGITSGTHSGTISAGYHTFQWMYYKDASVDANADTVWIDDVSLPITQTWFQNDTDDDNDGVIDDYDMAPTDPCVAMDTDGDGQPDWVLTGEFDMSGTGDEEFIVNCDDSDWYEDWDDDGDGWGDEEEWYCGSDSLSAEDTPSDGDGDWICDSLDDDLDNDDYLNPTDCVSIENLMWFLDCLVDNFNAVDSNNDGEVTADELASSWGVGAGGEYPSYICGDGSEIPFDWVNDGMVDCPLGADEQQFDDAGNKTNWFDCFDGSEIWMDQVNDGMDDCPGGEDEMPDEDFDVGMSEEEWNATWEWLMMFDADDSSTLSFDEYWDLNNCDEPACEDGFLDELGLENPGWNGSYGQPIDTEWDVFPLDSSEYADSDHDGMGDNEDNDDDNDGVPDADDVFPYDSTEWEDLDGDGIGDNSDDDTDGDGIPNDIDQFDTNPDASTDTDGDGADDASDSDDDGDGVPDVTDTFPMNPNEDADTDGDCAGTYDAENPMADDGTGCGDNSDDDDDNDLVLDVDDAFPLDATEYMDNDGDDIGDNADPDDDNDGIPDGVECPDAACYLQYDATESRDSDNDGTGDNADNDDDGDGVADADDAFPLNPNEDTDSDGDNIGDNADTDVDGDDVPDVDDPFPNDPTEWADTDGDGLGDEIADSDDDGDGYTDEIEKECGTDSKNPLSMPSDFDGDELCDALDRSDDRSAAEKAANAQESPGFTPGFPSVLAVVSLLGAALLGRRKDD